MRTKSVLISGYLNFDFYTALARKSANVLTIISCFHLIHGRLMPLEINSEIRRRPPFHPLSFILQDGFRKTLSGCNSVIIFPRNEKCSASALTHSPAELLC